jgi:hypothetical protein
MINCDIRTEKALEGKAKYFIILRHFVSLITICYHCHFLGSTPAASTTLRPAGYAWQAIEKVELHLFPFWT